MQCNVSNPDRYLRILVGVVLIILTVMGVIGMWGWIGIVPLATGIFRYCPAYTLLGIGGNKSAK
ncbi:Protein of unknown function DUF2892 [Burkholderiaceae bacterium]|jgi:hypothetical protein